MSIEVKTTHRQAFREIFNLIAKDGKIDVEGLKHLFVTIDYKLNDDQFNEIVQKIFINKE